MMLTEYKEKGDVDVTRGEEGWEIRRRAWRSMLNEGGNCWSWRFDDLM
jgi:hypothetical protein